MAEILAGQKVIHIDDEDYERISAFQWKTIDNIAGRIGRRPRPTGKIIGLASTLIGKRPGATKRLEFRDKDLRNFSKSNIHWCDTCANCLRKLDGMTSWCNHCFTDQQIAMRSRPKFIPTGLKYRYVTVDY